MITSREGHLHARKTGADAHVSRRLHIAGYILLYRCGRLSNFLVAPSEVSGVGGEVDPWRPLLDERTPVLQSTRYMGPGARAGHFPYFFSGVRGSALMSSLGFFLFENFAA